MIKKNRNYLLFSLIIFIKKYLLNKIEIQNKYFLKKNI